MNNSQNRILLVDALRGFALLLIILIHYIEHFELFHQPELRFFFSAETDSQVMKIVFKIVSGKAYSIFAFLFGLSFFIQMDRKASAGINFSRTFIWRMMVLLFIGFIHSLIYRGDILHIYAFMGIPLVLLFRVKTPWLIVIGILFAIQLPFIVQFIKALGNDEFEITRKIPAFWREGIEAYSGDSFMAELKYNLWKGRISVYHWTIYNGRYLQLFALFVAGLIIGRIRLFENLNKYKKQNIVALSISVLSYIVCLIILKNFSDWELNKVQTRLFRIIIMSYHNLAITAFVITFFISINKYLSRTYFFKLLSAYGKMSLSNYVFQAVTGVIIFHGFGFALYKYLGSTWSLMMGAIVFYLQALISICWNKRYYYGPLEWLWRCLTLWSFDIKFRKR